MKTPKTLIVSLFLCLFLVSCATKPTTKQTTKDPKDKITQKEEPEDSDVETPDETVEGADSETPPDDLPPVPKKDPTIAVVLGGAGVASWATVGILKKFDEAEVKINCIVTTGWPSIFSVGYGLFKSIHDLEWFARRLEKGNLYKSGLLDFKNYYDQGALTATLKKSFDERKALGQTRVPIWIVAAYPAESEPLTYSSGPWLAPLLKTMQTPGIYKLVHSEESGKNVPWARALLGIPVEEAKKCEADFVVSFEMYDDYLHWLGTGAKKKKDEENDLRLLYVSQLGKLLQRERQYAGFSARIELKKQPLDFSAKLGAIRSGYEKAAEILKKVRAAE